MVVPPETPKTTPEVPIVATPVLLLLQVPPVVASDSEVVAPTQMAGLPVITAGLGNMLIVTEFVVRVPPPEQGLTIPVSITRNITPAVRPCVLKVATGAPDVIVPLAPGYAPQVAPPSCEESHW